MAAYFKIGFPHNVDAFEAEARWPMDDADAGIPLPNKILRSRQAVFDPQDSSPQPFAESPINSARNKAHPPANAVGFEQPP